MSRKLWHSANQKVPDLWLSTRLTPKLIRQLIQFSTTDPQVIANTHDQERFGSEAAVQKWLQKAPSLFVLETAEEELQGLAWVSHKPLPMVVESLVDLPASKNFTLTFGIRLYAGARGKRLAIPFLETVLSHFKTQNEQFWLKTKASNIPAIETYRALGFKFYSAADAAGDIVMILPHHS